VQASRKRQARALTHIKQPRQRRRAARHFSA
jgi:hypothetical protein